LPYKYFSFFGRQNSKPVQVYSPQGKDANQKNKDFKEEENQVS